MDELLLSDPELAKTIILESDRQLSKLEMIASENFVSAAVRQALGSVMTHKYSEGYPGARFDFLFSWLQYTPLQHSLRCRLPYLMSSRLR